MYCITFLLPGTSVLSGSSSSSKSLPESGFFSSLTVVVAVSLDAYRKSIQIIYLMFVITN